MSSLDRFDAFERNLKEKYPEMYENVYCGISIDQGWFKIIEDLSAVIYHHYTWKIKQGKETKYPTVAQIKEKFGGLRFYVDGADGYADGAIALAEAIADRTCEVCGAPGSSRKGGWIKTLCDHHDQERQQRKKEDSNDYA